MKRIVRLTESDLARIVKRVINEAEASPATYGDYIANENYTTELAIPVWASLNSNVTAEKYKNQPANKLTVQADVYVKKDGAWKFTKKETATFYQICGAKANYFSKDGFQTPGEAGYKSKPGGPIQQKLVKSCKAQGFTGQIQGPLGFSIS